MDPRYDVLDDAARLARVFVDGLGERPVGAQAAIDELRAALSAPLGEQGEDARTVIFDLVGSADPGLIASAGPRISALSSAGRCRPRSPRTGWCRRGIRMAAALMLRRRCRWSRRSPPAGSATSSACPPIAGSGL